MVEGVGKTSFSSDLQDMSKDPHLTTLRFISLRVFEWSNRQWQSQAFFYGLQASPLEANKKVCKWIWQPNLQTSCHEVFASSSPLARCWLDNSAKLWWVSTLLTHLSFSIGGFCICCLWSGLCCFLSCTSLSKHSSYRYLQNTGICLRTLWQ